MLEFLTSPLVLQMTGLAACGLILLRGGLGALDWWQRRRQQADYELQRREVLQQRIERARWNAQRARKLSEWRWEGHRKFVVERKVVENALGDVCSLYLRPHDNRPLPEFKPGQFLTFKLAIPGQRGQVVRCYSLSNAFQADASKTGYRISVKRLEGGVCSNYFHNTLEVGDILDAEAPRGSFYLDMEHRWPVVLFAGGVGVTPMLSMLEALHAERQSRRPVWLFYGVRSPAELIQRERLEAIAHQNPAIEVWFCYSQPDTATLAMIRRAHTPGNNEPVRHFARRVKVSWVFRDVLPKAVIETAHFYTCGPPPMMEALQSDLTAQGVPLERCHTEAFGPASVSSSQRKAAAESGVGFRVVFARSGKKLHWSGNARNLLELAEQNGVALNSGCRVGACSDCKVAVRSGSVSYATPPNARIEPGTCLTCQAVPAADLILDA